VYSAEPSINNSTRRIPPDIFEALVSAWRDLLLEDVLARHPELRDQISSPATRRPTR
jgi:hypothetical protein